MEEDKAKVVHRQEFAKISSRRIGTDAIYFIAIINFINDAKKKGKWVGKICTLPHVAVNLQKVKFKWKKYQEKETILRILRILRICLHMSQ